MACGILLFAVFGSQEFRYVRRVIGPKREEVTGGWRRLYNEELPNLYASPNFIRVVKSRRLIRAYVSGCVCY
jgi:hypothetical protein